MAKNNNNQEDYSARYQMGLLSGLQDATTEDEYRRYNDLMLRQQAREYAQLDPFARATASIYQGANQLGGALGGLLGAEDPALQRISQRQQLTSNIDPTDYASMLQGAQQLYKQGFTGDAKSLISQAQQYQNNNQTGQLNQYKLNQAQDQDRERLKKLAKDENVQAVLQKLGPDATPEEIKTALLPYMDAPERLDFAKLKVEAGNATKRTAAVNAMLSSSYQGLPEDVKAFVLSDEKTQNSLLAAAVQDERAKKLAVEKATQVARSNAGAGGLGSTGNGMDDGDGVSFTKKQLDLSQQNYRGALEGLSVLKDIRALLPQATGSGVGSLVDNAAGFFGKSTEGARATAQLKVLSSKLLQAVPRFEGPQSDRDVQTYKEAAGQLADDTLPVETRMAAWSTIEGLLQRQASTEGSRIKRGGFDLNAGNNPPPPTGGNAGVGGRGAPKSSFPGGRGIGSFGG